MAKIKLNTLLGDSLATDSFIFEKNSDNPSFLVASDTPSNEELPLYVNPNPSRNSIPVATKKEESLNRFSPRDKSVVNPDNIKNYLSTKGYSKTAIAGILANIEGESSFNSNAVGDNGMSFGLFQHNKSRRDNLIKFLNGRGLNDNDWKGQVDFAETEVSPSLKRKMNNAKTPEEAASIWVDEFERPANRSGAKSSRGRMSRKYYAFGGVIPKYANGGVVDDGYNKWKKKYNLEETEGYNLKRAYQLGYIPDENGHLPSIDEKTLKFLKRSDHPTIQKELDWYNSEEASDFRSKYRVDSTSNKNWWRYVPKKDMGGYINSGGYMNTYEQPNVGGSIIGGVLSGAGTGASAGPWGMLAGAVVGGVAGAFTGSKKKRQYQDSMRKQNVMMNQYMQKQSDSILSMYDQRGTAGQFGYYKFGGKLPKYMEKTIDEPEYEVEKNEVVQGADAQIESSKQLASDLQLVGGERHEKGGTLGAGGERAFSDRLFIGNELAKLLKDSGLKKVKPNQTYASVALELGKMKGVNEEKLASNDYISKNTGNVMLGKINNLLDLTFNIQEMYKVNQGIGQDQDGQINPDQEQLALEEEMIQPAFANGGKLPKYATGFNNSDWAGLGLSTASLINNLVSNSRTRTNVPVFLQNAPAYLYRDRSGLQRAENRASYRNLITNPALQGTVRNQQAFASLIKQDNQIAQNENLRKDQYDQNYQNTALSIDSRNLGAMQRGTEQQMQLENAKIQQQSDIGDKYLSNINSVLTQKAQRELQEENLRIIREQMKYNRQAVIAQLGFDPYPNNAPVNMQTFDTQIRKNLKMPSYIGVNVPR